MKIPQSQFKTVIKECLKELIAEGALNNAIAQLIQSQGIPMAGIQSALPADPRIQAVAQSVARNGGDAKLYEAIFQDAMGTMAHQDGGDPQRIMQNGMGGMGAMGGMNGMMPQQMGGNYYQNYQGYQQPMMQQPQQYMQMPVQQPMMAQQSPQNQMMLHQQGQNSTQGGISRWAQLAFNSPIKNRPDGEGGLSGMGSGGAPGSNMGKFD